MGSKFGAGVVAGLVATLVMTILLYLAPLMGLPEMNIPGMLGTMFASPGTGATVLGLGLHFMMGAILALIYAYGFQAVPPGAPWLRGALYGVLPYLSAAPSGRAGPGGRSVRSGGGLYLPSLPPLPER